MNLRGDEWGLGSRGDAAAGARVPAPGEEARPLLDVVVTWDLFRRGGGSLLLSAPPGPARRACAGTTSARNCSFFIRL